MDKVNLGEKLRQFAELWSPRIVGELNGQHVKLAKLSGEFVWHHHVLLLEPAGTLNTGNLRNERTIDSPARI